MTEETNRIPGPMCSVVIPTFGRDAALYNLLVVLSHQTHPPDEIIVVDQTPKVLKDRQIRRCMQDLFDAGRIVWINSTTPGLTMARNLGLKQATGQVLMYLDDDVIIGKSFVEAHLRNYRDPSVQCVSGGTRCQSQPLPVPLEGELDRSPLGFLSCHNGYNERIEGFNRICGGNFSITRRALEAIGGFDENFRGASHREDIDLAFRLKEAGIDIVFDPQPWAYHLHFDSGGGRARAANEKGTLSYNASYFALRHLRGLDFARFMWEKVMRSTVFSKKNALHPWSLPGCLLAFLRDFWRAREASRKGPRLIEQTGGCAGTNGTRCSAQGSDIPLRGRGIRSQ